MEPSTTLSHPLLTHYKENPTNLPFFPTTVCFVFFDSGFLKDYCWSRKLLNIKFSLNREFLFSLSPERKPSDFTLFSGWLTKAYYSNSYTSGQSDRMVNRMLALQKADLGLIPVLQMVPWVHLRLLSAYDWPRFYPWLSIWLHESAKIGFWAQSQKLPLSAACQDRKLGVRERDEKEPGNTGGGNDAGTLYV